jgi:hypothetical protein
MDEAGSGLKDKIDAFNRSIIADASEPAQCLAVLHTLEGDVLLNQFDPNAAARAKKLVRDQLNPANPASTAAWSCCLASS